VTSGRCDIRSLRRDSGADRMRFADSRRKGSS
jgi:hypothetical protein